MPIAAVLDTGVVVIGALYPDSGSRIVLQAWLDGRLAYLTSWEMIDEYQRVMRDVFAVSPQVTSTWLRLMEGRARVVVPVETIEDCRDPNDNIVLEAAVCGEAEFIVTFDGDLWKMSPYRGIQILTVRNFLRKTGLGPRRRSRPSSTAL